MNVVHLSVIGMLWVGLCGGCAARGAPAVVAAEQKMVAHCTYVDTIVNLSNMGAPQVHPKFAYSGRSEVLRRAEQLDATHVVWLAEQPAGAAALAYRCGD